MKSITFIVFTVANPILFSHFASADRLSEIGAYTGSREVKPIIKDYQVSKGGGDAVTLQKVFDAVAELEKAKGSKLFDFLISSRIDERTFLAYPKTGTPYRKPDYTTTYLLVSDKDLNVADGESIDRVRANVTDEIREIEGSKLRVIKLNQEPTRITREEFVSRLKGGATWTLEKFNASRCEVCRGEGKINLDKRKLSTKATAVICKDCNGKGSVPVTLNVKW
jgi:hypothetical protein